MIARLKHHGVEFRFAHLMTENSSNAELRAQLRAEL